MSLLILVHLAILLADDQKFLHSSLAVWLKKRSVESKLLILKQPVTSVFCSLAIELLTNFSCKFIGKVNSDELDNT